MVLSIIYWAVLLGLNLVQKYKTKKEITVGHTL